MRHINEAAPRVLEQRRRDVPQRARRRGRRRAREGARRRASRRWTTFRRELPGVPRRGARRRAAGSRRLGPPDARGPAACSAAAAAAAPAARAAAAAAWSILLGLVAPRRRRLAAVLALASRWDHGDGGGANAARERRRRRRRSRFSGAASWDPPPATGRSTTPRRRTRPTATRPRTGRPRTTAIRPAALGKPASGSCSTPGGTVTHPPRDGDDATRPGFTARIQAGDSAGGPFHDVSDSTDRRGRARRSTSNGVRGRYFVVWITNLGAGGSRARERGHRRVAVVVVGAGYQRRSRNHRKESCAMWRRISLSALLALVAGAASAAAAEHADAAFPAVHEDQLPRSARCSGPARVPVRRRGHRRDRGVRPARHEPRAVRRRSGRAARRCGARRASASRGGRRGSTATRPTTASSISPRTARS